MVSAREVAEPGAARAALSCQVQGVNGGMPRVVESTDALVARRALGRQLAALRDAAGLTQHDLAPLVGYGRSTVGTVEIGKQRVGIGFQ